MAVEPIFTPSIPGMLRIESSVGGHVPMVTVTVSSPAATITLTPGAAPVEVPVDAGATVGWEPIAQSGYTAFGATVAGSRTSTAVEIALHAEADQSGWMEG